MPALAVADVISALVNEAAAQQAAVINVPDSDSQLNHGTVDVEGSGGAGVSWVCWMARC